MLSQCNNLTNSLKVSYGLGIVPSRNPNFSFIAKAMQIEQFHVKKLDPLNMMFPNAMVGLSYADRNNGSIFIESAI